MRLKTSSISRRWLLLAVVAVAVAASIVEAPALRGQNVPAGPISAPCAEVVRVPPTDSRFAPNVLSLSPGAARVALSVRTGTFNLKDVLKVYETATKQWVEPGVRVPAGEELQSLIFSPDGQWQLAHSLGPRLQRALRVYRASDMRECFAVKSDGYALSPTAFSADGKLLVRPEPPEGDKPFCFVVVNVETGAVRSTLHIERELLSFGMFHRIAFTADGKWVYSNQDDRVLVWDVTTGQLVTYWVWTGTGAVAALGSTAESRFVRALMQEGSIASFEVSVSPQKAALSRLEVPAVDPKEPRMVPFNKPWSFTRAAFSPDAASVLSDAGGKINMYDVRSGKLSREFTLPANAGGGCSFRRHREISCRFT